MVETGQSPSCYMSHFPPVPSVFQIFALLKFLLRMFILFIFSYTPLIFPPSLLAGVPSVLFLKLQSSMVRQFPPGPKANWSFSNLCGWSERNKNILWPKVAQSYWCVPRSWRNHRSGDASQCALRKWASPDPWRKQRETMVLVLMRSWTFI